MATTVGFSFSATSAMGGSRSNPLAIHHHRLFFLRGHAHPWLSPIPRAMQPAAKTDNPKTCLT